MQDQEQNQNPPDVLIAVTKLADGNLEVKPMVLGDEYQPEHDPAHAYAQAVIDEHPNLMRRLHGQPTDGDRYRALRDFAALAATDKARFERINEQFQKLEESLPPPDQRAPADHDTVADFLAFAILESEPVLEPDTDTYENRGIKDAAIILPHAPVLAKPH